MVPANPPLPTTCSLPFQPDDGSQTSALMSERGAGFECYGNATERSELRERDSGLRAGHPRVRSAE